MQLTGIEIVEDRTAHSRCDEGFLRIRGAAVPWRSPGEALPTHGALFRWDHGSFHRTAAKVTLPPEVIAYAERVTPMQLLPAPEDEQLERLRALGYGD